MASGRLVYIVGASGSGKDTVLRTIDAGGEWPVRVAIAPRFITRPIVNGIERHIHLSESDFRRRREQGLFAMEWRGHRYRYGIGTEIDAWMREGISVLVNGSRAYLPEAKRRYPDLLTIWLRVDEDTLKARLLFRGREGRADIESRLLRNDTLECCIPDEAYLVDNGGDLKVTVERILRIVVQSVRD